MTETDTRNGAIGGQLGTAAPRDTTFHGSDPETVAPDTICQNTPTHCQARTRLYRDGRLVEQGFAIERISDHLSDPGAMVWLDLRDPDHEDLAVLQEEFGLHPVAVEDALVDRERPKIDRYRTHLFLTAYSARLDMASGELATSELAAFILPHALITIRKDDGLDIGKVVDRWDASPDLAAHGVGYLVYGLLDYIVDGHFEAVQSLDDAVEGLEDDLFAPTSAKRPARAAALVRAAQVPRAAAPGGAADARGAEHRDAPRPAARQRGPDALLPGRLRPRAARGRVDGIAA